MFFVGRGGESSLYIVVKNTDCDGEYPVDNDMVSLQQLILFRFYLEISCDINCFYYNV